MTEFADDLPRAEKARWELPYAQARPRRFSLAATLACLWSVIVPLLMVAFTYAVGDVVDDWFERPALFLLFAALVLWSPLAGVALGGVALGRIRARSDELRGTFLAVTAIVLGGLWVIALAWLLAIAWRA